MPWYDQDMNIVPYDMGYGGYEDAPAGAPGPWASGYVPYYPDGSGGPPQPTPPPPAGKPEPAPSPAPTPTPAPPPAPAPAPGPAGGPITQPFTQPLNAPPPVNLGGPAGIPYIPQTPQYAMPTIPAPPTLRPTPAYDPGDPFTPNAFKAPSIEEAMNEPGYKFRIQQGMTGLQNWAAARGTLNDSSTATALEDYGQQAGSQEYQNVWNRDYGAWQGNEGNRLNAWQGNNANRLSTYNTNYQTQVQDPYQAAYRGWSDAILQPTMATFNANVGAGNLGYSTQAAAGQRQSEVGYQNAYDKWLQDFNIFKDQRDSTWNKNFAYATA